MTALTFASAAQAEPSDRTLSGAAIGAGTGALVAGPIGAVAGGVVGAVVGGPTGGPSALLVQPEWRAALPVLSLVTLCFWGDANKPGP